MTRRVKDDRREVVYFTPPPKKTHRSSPHHSSSHSTAHLDSAQLRARQQVESERARFNLSRLHSNTSGRQVITSTVDPFSFSARADYHHRNGGISSLEHKPLKRVVTAKHKWDSGSVIAANVNYGDRTGEIIYTNRNGYGGSAHANRTGVAVGGHTPHHSYRSPHVPYYVMGPAGRIMQASYPR